MDLDINDLLSDFSTENARQTQRAIVAEAQAKSLSKLLTNQQAIIASLEERIAALEAEPKRSAPRPKKDSD